MLRLLRSVVLPLVALALLAPAMPVRAQGLPLRPVEEPVFGLHSVVPEGWNRIGPGLYGPRNRVGDPTLLALQSGPVEPAQLLASILPQLALEAAPEPTGHRATDALTWTLYEVPGDTRTIDVALADGGDKTFVVVLVSKPHEHAELHRTVFLSAVDALKAIEPEPTASVGARPYRDHAVSFPGGATGVTLAGTLSLPVGEGPFPVVVLMSGSGPQDRDESIVPLAAIKPFALIADALARQRFAVLRYDDRGVGESTGNYATADIDQLTADARAAIDFVASRPELDHERIGLLGHSEGGVYLARLAASDPRVGFGVAMAGPASNGVDLLVAQYVAIARSSGGTPEEVEYTRQFAEEVFPLVVEGDRAAVEQTIRKHYGALYDRQYPDSSPDPSIREQYLDQQVAAQLTLYFREGFRSLLARDFSADWSRVRVPILAVYGGKDVQVPADHEAPVLEAALRRSGNTDSKVVTLPDANHLFQQADTGATTEYGILPATFTPDFLPTLIAWLTEHTAVPS
jgi:pimeloyl-ACP methyl ester carboxylesterase